jgi:hypothetical protein
MQGGLSSLNGRPNYVGMAEREYSRNHQSGGSEETARNKGQAGNYQIGMEGKERGLHGGAKPLSDHTTN